MLVTATGLSLKLATIRSSGTSCSRGTVPERNRSFSNHITSLEGDQRHRRGHKADLHPVLDIPAPVRNMEQPLKDPMIQHKDSNHQAENDQIPEQAFWSHFHAFTVPTFVLLMTYLWRSGVASSCTFRRRRFSRAARPPRRHRSATAAAGWS